MCENSFKKKAGERQRWPSSFKNEKIKTHAIGEEKMRVLSQHGFSLFFVTLLNSHLIRLVRLCRVSFLSNLKWAG